MTPIAMLTHGYPLQLHLHTAALWYEICHLAYSMSLLAFTHCCCSHVKCRSHQAAVSAVLRLTISHSPRHYWLEMRWILHSQ